MLKSRCGSKRWLRRLLYIVKLHDIFLHLPPFVLFQDGGQRKPCDVTKIHLRLKSCVGILARIFGGKSLCLNQSTHHNCWSCLHSNLRRIFLTGLRLSFNDMGAWGGRFLSTFTLRNAFWVLMEVHISIKRSRFHSKNCTVIWKILSTNCTEWYEWNSDSLYQSSSKQGPRLRVHHCAGSKVSGMRKYK